MIKSTSKGKFMKKLIVLASALAISTASLAFEGENDPRYLDVNYTKSFRSLPLKGELNSDRTPWSSSFWPSIYGGIAFRWNGYYQEAPLVKDLQAQVGALKDKIKELKKMIFTTNPSAVEINSINQLIYNANTKKKELLARKSREHQRVFFDIKRPKNLGEVRLMKQGEIDRLSAAEKFDIYKALITGTNYTTRLTNKVLSQTGAYKQYWEGICNGWSSAAIEFHEPLATTITLNGITVNFGSSDLKALLAYYHSAITSNVFTVNLNRTGRVGNRCETEFPAAAWTLINGREYYKTVVNGRIVTKPVPAKCVDVDPGAFHIVLANQIALKQQGFVAEVVRDKEIWNQPVFGYDSEIVSETSTIRPNATRGTHGQVHMKTRMNYTNDGGRMFWQQDDPEEAFYAWWDATNGTPDFRADHKDFEYILDLDINGKIIGGMWLSYERADFLWMKKSKGFLGSRPGYGIVGYLDALRNLVQIRD